MDCMVQWEKQLCCSNIILNIKFISPFDKHFFNPTKQRNCKNVVK